MSDTVASLQVYLLPLNPYVIFSCNNSTRIIKIILRHYLELIAVVLARQLKALKENEVNTVLNQIE